MRDHFAALLLLWGLSAAAPAAAHPPYGLVADPAGNVYFSDLEAVWRLSPDGRFSIFRPAVPERHVHALAPARDGGIEGDQNRYDPATQRFYSGLWHRTPAGVERDVVPMTERAPLGAGLWQDAAGNRYVTHWRSSTDRRTMLLRRRPDGRVDLLFAEGRGADPRAQTSVESVGGMAFGADGALLFADGSVLRRLAPDGTVTKVYDGGAGSSLRGLAVAPDGRVLAADMGAKAVLTIAADGTATTLYREASGWLPTAVALAGTRLLVLQANAAPYERKDRVRLIEVRDGKARVAASPADTQRAAGPPAPPRADGTRSRALIPVLAVLAVSAALFIVWQLRARGDSNTA